MLNALNDRIMLFSNEFSLHYWAEHLL